MDCTLRFACYMLDVIYDMSHVIWYLLYVIWYMVYMLCYIWHAIFFAKRSGSHVDSFACQLARLLVASAAAPKRRRPEAMHTVGHVIFYVLFCHGVEEERLKHCPKLVQKLMVM